MDKLNDLMGDLNNIIRYIEYVKSDLRKAIGSSQYKTDEEYQFKVRYIDRLLENELADAKSGIEYIVRDVKYEGTLQLQIANGRYDLDGCELSTGSSVEIWDEEEQDWIIGRIEHSYEHGGYYFYQKPSIMLHGARARKR